MIFAVIFRFVSAAVSRTWVDRAARKVTQVADTPDSTLDAMQTAVNGLVVTNATATGVVTTYGYDALGRQVTASSVSDNGARTVGQTLHYNGLGQVDWTENGATNRTAFAYDNAGRQGAVTNALGQVTTTLYDALGNVTNVTGATYPVSYGYDAWNRMVWMKTYRDENGAGDLTQWQHDLATGLVTNKVYADGKGTAYAYTADGKLSRRTWARGIATDYGYTAVGELETVDYSDATPDVTYTHDRLGRVVEAITAGVCTNTYSYDVATLARSGETRRSVFGPTETLVRQQDVLGRPAGLTLGNDYAVGYGYDTVGRFGTVASTNTANAVTGQWTYERVPGSDLVAGWTAAAGNSWRRSYENNRDLIAETHSGYGATVLDSYGYTNDALGRRTARVDAGVTTNAFGYNLRSEVISAMMGSDQFGYGYDPIGNRLTATNNTAVTTYFANELNQYTNIVNGASAEPTYDDDGNMLAFGNGWTATWDGENRLVQLSKDGEQIGYAYDHQSRRIAKQTAAGVEVFSYDDWAMIRHTAPGGGKTDYIYGLDLSGTPQGAGTVGGLLGMTRAGDTAPICYGYDANGNVTLLADGSGTVAARYAYDPFGNTLSTTGTLASVNPFRFSTKYWENEAGLYYYGYRYYSPELGRWLSRDPIGERGGNNILIYLFNNPVNLSDNLGLSGCCGPDVTTAVNATLRNIEKMFNDINNDETQRNMCEALYDPSRANGSWDIHKLAQAGMMDSSPFGDSLPTGTGDCRRSVVYSGKCVYAGSLNYIMFGKMNQLCRGKYANRPYSVKVPIVVIEVGVRISWSLFDAENAVTYRKNIQLKDFGETAAQAFDYTAIGYQGHVPLWAKGISLTGGSLKDCDISQSRPIKERELSGHWAGHSF